MKPHEVFHGGVPASASEVRRLSNGVRSKGQVFHAASAVSTTAYGGELRILVHPLAGSVSAIPVSYKLEPGESSREISPPDPNMLRAAGLWTD